jgi:2-oxoglutarate ferredoxin oxidoreductase subunit beta
MAQKVKRKPKDYRGDKSTWCPGCGDFAVLSAVYQALAQLELDPAKTVIVSGIGCSSRVPFFINTYGFQSVHGRALPVAMGVKIANPELTVIAMGGDGDGFSIGGGHLAHVVRRNVDLTYIVMDNAVYGLTKGQTSPTSPTGFESKSTPYGAINIPVNPMMVVLAAGATFAARCFSGRAKQVTELIIQGMQHRGLAFIDVLSPCVTFYNTFPLYREQVTDLPADHDPSDKMQAIAQALREDALPLGLFYREERRVFSDVVRVTSRDGDFDLAGLLEEYR